MAMHVYTGVITRPHTDYNGINGDDGIQFCTVLLGHRSLALGNNVITVTDLFGKNLSSIFYYNQVLYA